jgi:hypothetical protein
MVAHGFREIASTLLNKPANGSRLSLVQAINLGQLIDNRQRKWTVRTRQHGSDTLDLLYCPIADIHSLYRNGRSRR